jgi:hypothetical protein
MNEWRKISQYHPDVALFLILIPFISAFNYYLTYSGIKLSSFLLLTFTIDTAQGYLAWWAVRTFIFWLDVKIPYGDKPLRRIITQLILTSIIGLLIISLLTELVSWIAKGKGVPMSFYTIDLFIISIWFFVMNGIYSGLYYYNGWQQSEQQRKEENRVKEVGLMVKQGKVDMKLSFEEIAGFFVDGEYAVACHVNGKKFYLDQSLDKIEQTLPLMFFRLNRQYIVHRTLVSGFRRVENGKLEVMLNKTETLPAEVSVSRTKAASFKGWFQAQ